MGQLDGRVILVTGASRGIGLAIARDCAREGGEAVMVARHAAALRTAARAVQGRAMTIAADVTRPADVGRLFRTLRARYRRLDALVNCAGVFTYKSFERTTLGDWRANLETNLTSLFLTTKAALPLLGRSRRPQIVNILSIASLHAFPKCSAYTAAKFGALGFTRVLAEELRRRRIRVTAVIPGTTDTRMANEFDFPVNRARLLKPEDVARAALAALLEPERASLDEIVLTPARGNL